MRSLIIAAIITACFCIGMGSPMAAEFSVQVEFGAGEAEIIAAWFADHGIKESPRKGRKALPPGIAKNLQRGKPLPPGIARQVLPAELVRRLPPLPGGYERVIVDGKVLLVEIATRVIHDVLVGVILD